MTSIDRIEASCLSYLEPIEQHYQSTIKPEKQTPYNNVELLRKQFAELEARFQSVVQASAQVIAAQQNCIKELEKAIHALKYK
jgi:hypothetical protein